MELFLTLNSVNASILSSWSPGERRGSGYLLEAMQPLQPFLSLLLALPMAFYLAARLGGQNSSPSGLQLLSDDGL